MKFVNNGIYVYMYVVYIYLYKYILNYFMEVVSIILHKQTEVFFAQTANFNIDF